MAGIYGRGICDIMENNDCFEIFADVLGFIARDVLVHLQDEVLIINILEQVRISGDHLREPEKDALKVWNRERRMPHISRAFKMPSNAECEAVTARLTEGVLVVRIPKLPEVPKPGPRHIPLHCDK